MTASLTVSQLPGLIGVDWWNPAAWLQNIGGFFSGLYDAGSAIKNTLGGVLTIFEQVFRFFTDTGHFMRDAVKWAVNALFPPELQTWFLGTVGYPGQQWDPSQIFQGVYQAVQAPALLIAAVASASRILRATLDHRLAAAHVLAEVLPRFLGAVALIGIPGTTVSLGYVLIVWTVDAMVQLAEGLFGLLLRASLLQGMQPGEGWFNHMFDLVANAGKSAVAVVIGGIPLLILILYSLFLMVVRTIMLGFCIATAPLCFATLAFDSNNRFFHWWLDLFVSVLMTPIVLGVSIALSITLASSVVSALAVGPILAFVIMCGGLWFSAKAVHHLSWRHFSHGSALAGFAAGVSTVLGPMHTVGSVAEALGANRGGGNPALNFIKRVGGASHGVGPASTGGGGGSSRPLAQGGQAGNVRPGGGLPDIAASLSSAGRPAIAGVETRFAQNAFNAFARGHANTIGRLTQDHPEPSLSSVDRAKLAWERTAPNQQTAFADEFLSQWLGGSNRHAGPVWDAPHIAPAFHLPVFEAEAI
jgi:hypothetical protein